MKWYKCNFLLISDKLNCHKKYYQKIMLVFYNYNMQNNQIAGNPLEFLIPNLYSNILSGQANSFGYGKNLENWVICSHLPLQVISSETKCLLHLLKDVKI